MSRNCIFQIVTPQLLRDTVLGGVDLRLDNGDPFPDAMLERSIQQGVSQVEISLDILLRERTIENERHDHTQDFLSDWTRFHLNKGPVQRVTGFDGYYGTLNPVNYPPEWLQITSANKGYVSIVPTTNSASYQTLGSAGGLRIELFMGALAGVPDWYRMTYVAGFPCLKGTLTIPDGDSEVTWAYPVPLHSDFVPEVFLLSDDTLETISISSSRVTFGTRSGDPVDADTEFTFLIHTFPQLVIDLILRRAAQVALHVAGDLVLGAGIAGYSRSMDGLVEAVQSTSSPTNSGYGARVLSLDREAKELEALLRPMFRGSNFFAM